LRALWRRKPGISAVFGAKQTEDRLQIGAEQRSPTLRLWVQGPRIGPDLTSDRVDFGPAHRSTRGAWWSRDHGRRPGRSAIIFAMVESRPEAPTRSSEDPFTDFVLPELEVMYRVARSLTRNPTDAEDLVQDTLIRAYKAIDRFDGRYPRAWLLTIMRNAQLNRVRRKRPELMRDPDLTMKRVADTSEEGRNVEDQVLGSVFDERVESALVALPEKFRTVIEMVDMNGLAYQEAADVIGVPVGTVMSRLHRGRKRIRDDLEAAGITRRSPGSPSAPRRQNRKPAGGDITDDRSPVTVVVSEEAEAKE